MIQMAKFYAFAVAAVVLFCAGCNTGPTLVGKWKGDISSQGQTMTADIEFTAAGKMLTSFQVQGMTINGTQGYTVSGDTLTTTMEDVKISGGNLPPQIQQMVQAEVEKQKGKKETAKFKFVDGDTVELSSNNQKMTWKRVK